MKNRRLNGVLSFIISVACVAIAAPARAGVGTDAAQKLFDDITPSMVAVQYTHESELSRRELICSGIIVGSDGLVMAPLAMFGPGIPDDQMKEFKIIVPKSDADDVELDAIFLGRDERTNLAFLKTKEKQNWKAVKFEKRAVKIGQSLMSIGMLPKNAGYRTYFTEAVVSAPIRGETPMVLVNGGLGAMGAAVFDTDGTAIGYVNQQPALTTLVYGFDGRPAGVASLQSEQTLLNDTTTQLAGVAAPPRFFVPASDFLLSFSDLPVAGQPMKLPWIGVIQMAGLQKEVADFFGLKNQPAIELGDVLPGSPAEKAGLKRGDKIVKMNGQPLERGDEPDELPGILSHKIKRMKVGDKIVLSVLEKKDAPLKDVTITLEEQPKRANLARRFYADDLGFGVRELVFIDTYVRKLPTDQKGVLVSLIKPQGNAAKDLRAGDLITELNGTAITDLDQFRTTYEGLRKDKPNDAIKLVVLREGNTQVIRIEPPQ